MIKVFHRVNNSKNLIYVNSKYGIEVDVHGYEDNIIVNHDPLIKSKKFSLWLKEYNHKILFVNVKEEGIEKEVIKILNKKNISNFVLFDVSFPFIFKLLDSKQQNLAIRVSKYEPIEGLFKLKNKPRWIWLDLFDNSIPLSQKNYIKIKKYKIKIIIVSPELHGRNLNDIATVQNNIKKNNFKFDAVCTKAPKLWN